MEDTLLSPAAFAKRSGLHVETVRDMCRRGDLRAKKLGKRVWRIPSSELRETGPQAEPTEAA